MSYEGWWSRHSKLSC